MERVAFGLYSTAHFRRTPFIIDHTGFRQCNKQTTETMLEYVNTKHLNTQGQ